MKNLFTKCPELHLSGDNDMNFFKAYATVGEKWQKKNEEEDEEIMS